MATIAIADVRAAVPDMTGEVAIKGLGAPVEVMRDAYGVPHIRARGADDVFIALGFVHAQDRLWQMDATRRRGLVFKPTPCPTPSPRLRWRGGA